MIDKEYQEMQERCRALSNSRDIWLYVATLFIFIALFLFMAIYQIESLPKMILGEVLEITEYHLPNNIRTIEIKFNKIEGKQEESKESFFIETPMEINLKKGGKYVFVYKGGVSEKLSKIGIHYNLLRIYEIK
jgi:hypothetical protein